MGVKSAQNLWQAHPGRWYTKLGWPIQLDLEDGPPPLGIVQRLRV